MIKTFLDCDTLGSEWIDQEEVRTTGETVCECKDENKQCRFARDTEANLPIACSLEPCADVYMKVLSQLDRDTGRTPQLLV